MKQRIVRRSESSRFDCQGAKNENGNSQKALNLEEKTQGRDFSSAPRYLKSALTPPGDLSFEVHDQNLAVATACVLLGGVG